MTGTSIWHSNKYGDCEIDASIEEVWKDEQGNTYVVFEWDCKQLGWGQYSICFTKDNKFVMCDDEYMESENLPFLGAMLQSLLNKNKESK